MTMHGLLKVVKKCNSLVQDFAYAAKSVRMRGFSQRIRPFAVGKFLMGGVDFVTMKP